MEPLIDPCNDRFHKMQIPPPHRPMPADYLFETQDDGHRLPNW